MAGQFPRRGLDAQTYVIPEQGRWVVYLDVALAPEGAGPYLEAGSAFEVVRRRIADYGSEAEAEVAARLFRRGAARDLPSPPTGC
ncbi:MAG: hypothetical protein MI919_26690 [Holophagales bacterium]|nr:hypothetical protein [Holophagales bacterium]